MTPDPDGQQDIVLDFLSHVQPPTGLLPGDANEVMATSASTSSHLSCERKSSPDRSPRMDQALAIASAAALASLGATGPQWLGLVP